MMGCDRYGRLDEHRDYHSTLWDSPRIKAALSRAMNTSLRSSHRRTWRLTSLVGDVGQEEKLFIVSTHSRVTKCYDKLFSGSFAYAMGIASEVVPPRDGEIHDRLMTRTT
ncbi:hypothetical protein BJV78DRAFT_139272 [Lactifluus subvellereus]|nr:hypothetical protein BJV78DRAFT_139272 [Lactifluus subvellereus]